MEDDKAYLSINEFAKKIGKHPNTIRLAIKNGRLNAFRIGSSINASYRIPISEINRIAVVHYENVSKQLPKGTIHG